MIETSKGRARDQMQLKTLNFSKKLREQKEQLFEKLS